MTSHEVIPIELLLTFIIAIAIQIILFIPAFIWKTDKLTDLSYALTFITLTLIVFFMNPSSTAKLILLVMICIWGMRLGGYLFIRIRKMDRDKRFDGIREHFWKFLKFWILQGVSVWVILLAALFFLLGEGTASTITYIGLAIWAVGFLTETVADLQKYRFMNSKKNKGKWIDEGLWHYSRHPNYFGEITCWVGIYLFTFPALTTAYKLIALISPLYIAGIILFVTGLPPLEKYAEERWGKDKKYKAYKRNTSILVPWFRRG